MEPSMTPLEPCQIRSIEAVGCISTFELGLRCRESIWQNRVSTGYILLAVPTKALQYGSLDWVVNYDDFRGMPMTLSARKFVQASHDRGEDPVKELNAVDAIGIRKCVVVDLRGIGINRKMGLFFAEDALYDVLACVAGTKLVPAKAVFDDRLWDKLGVQGRVAKDAAVCDIMHSEGITEMMLLKSQDCGGTLDKVTNSQDTMLLEPKSKTKVGECLFSTAVLAANAKYIPCSKTKCGGLTTMLCENPNCLANNVMRWATQAMFRIILGKQIFLAFNLKLLEALQTARILKTTEFELQHIRRIALGMSLKFKEYGHFIAKIGFNFSDDIWKTSPQNC
ncbi:hypothetical protein SELMODRAFT_429982 [Selaginella moellendorffii]|uniref:Uncharacterized protein n=1 Tax=Selaginella moellendorffii TaxID=88036 RepID=D8T7Y6_SELML|nr:hypothetical protein SELMODRAFT_429982 [Selaginella moellendorffii]